jgi:hypothetical protein
MRVALACCVAQLHRFALTFAILSIVLTGCAGAYITPSAHAPMMSQAGDVRVTAGARPLVPQRGMYAKATVAATQHLRLGVQIAGANAKHSDLPFAYQAYHAGGLRTRYAEATAGYEHPNRWLTWGLLPSVGYGVTEVSESLCDGRRAPLMACDRGPNQQLKGSYLRYGLEGYVGIRPVPWANVALGARAAWVHLRADEIDHAPSNARFDFGAIEPFGTARLEYAGLSGELQVRYSNLVHRPHDAEGDRLVAPSQLSFTLGVGVRFPRPAARWPAGYWRPRSR